MKISTFVALCELFLLPNPCQSVVTRCISNGMFAMTWDYSPSKNTNLLLDILSDQRIKATFHVLLPKDPTETQVESIIRIVEEGHQVGLAISYDLLEIETFQVKAIIKNEMDRLERLIGYPPKVVRLLKNSFDRRIEAILNSLGLTITEPNISLTRDHLSSINVFNQFSGPISFYNYGRGNFISVLFDQNMGSVKATPRIISLAKESGYQFVTLNTCIGIEDDEYTSASSNSQPIIDFSDSAGNTPDIDLGF